MKSPAVLRSRAFLRLLNLVLLSKKTDAMKRNGGIPAPSVDNAAEKVKFKSKCRDVVPSEEDTEDIALSPPTNFDLEVEHLRTFLQRRLPSPKAPEHVRAWIRELPYWDPK